MDTTRGKAVRVAPPAIIATSRDAERRRSGYPSPNAPKGRPGPKTARAERTPSSFAAPQARAGTIRKGNSEAAKLTIYFH